MATKRAAIQVTAGKAAGQVTARGGGLRAKLLRCSAGCEPGCAQYAGWVRVQMSSPPRALMCTEHTNRNTRDVWVLHTGLVVVFSYTRKTLLSRLLYKNIQGTEALGSLSKHISDVNVFLSGILSMSASSCDDSCLMYKDVTLPVFRYSVMISMVTKLELHRVKLLIIKLVSCTYMER